VTPASDEDAIDFGPCTSPSGRTLGRAALGGKNKLPADVGHSTHGDCTVWIGRSSGGTGEAIRATGKPGIALCSMAGQSQSILSPKSPVISGVASSARKVATPSRKFVGDSIRAEGTLPGPFRFRRTPARVVELQPSRATRLFVRRWSRRSTRLAVAELHEVFLQERRAGEEKKSPNAMVGRACWGDVTNSGKRGRNRGVQNVHCDLVSSVTRPADMD